MSVQWWFVAEILVMSSCSKAQSLMCESKVPPECWDFGAQFDLVQPAKVLGLAWTWLCAGLLSLPLQPVAYLNCHVHHWWAQSHSICVFSVAPSAASDSSQPVQSLVQLSHCLLVLLWLSSHMAWHRAMPGRGNLSRMIPNTASAVYICPRPTP